MINNGYPYYKPNLFYDIKTIEKRNLRKKSNGLGFFIFAYYMAMSVTSIISFLLLQFFCDSNIYLNKIDKTALYLIEIFVSVISALFSSLFYLVFSKSNINDTIKSKHTKTSLLIPIILIGMAGAMFANFASDIVSENFSIFGLQNSINFNNSSNTLENNILYVISTALVPAFAEEFAFRGILMGSLRKYGDAFAIIASSVLFGAMHGNIVQIPFAFILGLIFAFVDCKTNSIFPSIIIHFVNNFYAVIFDILQNEGIISTEIFYLVYYIVIICFCILGLISFIVLINKDKTFFKISDKNDRNNQFAKNLILREKCKAFFLAPGVIVSLSLFLLETLNALSVVSL